MLCSFVLDVLWWLLGMFPPNPQATCSPSCHNLQEAVQEGSAGPAKELHSVSTKARIGDTDGTVQDMGWLRAVHNCIHPVCVEPRWRQMGHPAVIASPLSLSGTAQWAWSMGWPASALFLQQAEQSWSQPPAQNCTEPGMCSVVASYQGKLCMWCLCHLRRAGLLESDAAI